MPVPEAFLSTHFDEITPALSNDTLAPQEIVARLPESTATPEFSVVMPCLNEAETLETCIRKAQRSLREHNVAGEIIIADNGSTDGSQAIATRLGARVIRVEAKGYGSALMGGINAARGKYVIMGDADDSYDFTNLKPFVDKLREGYHLVMGNRFKGGIKPNAMPPLHKYLGNPVLTAVGRILFHSPCGDFHCGLRGFSKEAITKLDLHTTGMEFASEMVVKATLQELRIAEVPTTLSPDGRSRPPHLRSWRDGWRHLRFLMLYSPRWLFLYPGLLMMAVGTLLSLYLLPGPQVIEGIQLDVHTLLYAALAITLGYQAVIFSVLTKLFAISEGLLPPDEKLKRHLKPLSLEKGLVTGGIFILAGLAGSVAALLTWRHHNFGLLNPSEILRLIIPACTAIALGVQTAFASLFKSVLELKRK